MNSTRPTLLLTLALASAPLAVADELADLEAKFGARLAEVQRPIAERHIARLRDLAQKYQREGQESPAYYVGSEIRRVTSRLSGKGPLAFFEDPEPFVTKRDGFDRGGEDGEKESRKERPGEDFDDLPTERRLDLSLGTCKGTVEYEAGTGKIVGWRDGGVVWPRDIKLQPGMYEVLFKFACPPGNGGVLEIDVPGRDQQAMFGREGHRTETWAATDTVAVCEFEVGRWARSGFDFGIKVVRAVDGGEVLHLSGILIRRKEGE